MKKIIFLAATINSFTYFELSLSALTILEPFVAVFSRFVKIIKSKIADLRWLRFGSDGAISDEAVRESGIMQLVKNVTVALLKGRQKFFEKVDFRRRTIILVLHKAYTCLLFTLVLFPIGWYETFFLL